MMINLHVDPVTKIGNAALEKLLKTMNLTSFNRDLPDMLKEIGSIHTQIKAMGDVVCNKYGRLLYDVLQILKCKLFSEPS